MPNADELLLEIGLERGLLTPKQAGVCRESARLATEAGVKVTLAKVAQDLGLLSRDEILDVRREMAERGVLPRIGDYEVIANLAEGGMASVYKARQVSLDRVVALKVLSPELSGNETYVERFRREGLLAAKLRHPNAVEVYEVGAEGGRHYLAMEYVDGSDVSRELARGRMDEARALAIVEGVAGALAVAHAQGIVHRDIKPANIMLTWDGAAKLADLGIAKQRGRADLELTRTGQVIGSPYYMSPEQCEGVEEVDGRSDIYSLGVTLYRMACGRPPFSGKTTMQVARQRLDATPPDPKRANPKLSDATAGLIRRMIARRPEQRFQTCEELIAAIRKIRRDLGYPDPVAGSGGRAFPIQGPVEREGAVSSREMLLALLVAVGLAGFLGLGAGVAIGRRTPPARFRGERLREACENRLARAARLVGEKKWDEALLALGQAREAAALLPEAPELAKRVSKRVMELRLRRPPSEPGKAP